jgi:hypothetical protein
MQSLDLEDIALRSSSVSPNCTSKCPVSSCPSSVAETSSRNEVVDSAGFVLKLIGYVRDCLGAPALPVILPSSETRARLGEFGPPAPDRVAQTIGAQA